MKVILIATAAILIAISLLVQTGTLFAFMSPLPSPKPTQSVPPTYQSTDDEMPIGPPMSTPDPNFPDPDKPTPINITRQPIDPTPPIDKPTLPIKETSERDNNDDDNGDDHVVVQEGRTWQSLLLPWKWFAAWQTVK